MFQASEANVRRLFVLGRCVDQIKVIGPLALVNLTINVYIHPSDPKSMKKTRNGFQPNKRYGF